MGVSISDFQYPQVGHLDPSYGVDIGFGSARDHCREVDGTAEKELQMLAVQAGMSAGQLRAAASASNGVASGALI